MSQMHEHRVRAASLSSAVGAELVVDGSGVGIIRQAVVGEHEAMLMVSGSGGRRQVIVQTKERHPNRAGLRPVTVSVRTSDGDGGCAFCEATG